MSREYTRDETRNALLDHVWTLIHFWRHETRATTDQERLEGLAFSILSTLDGENGDIPKFIVAPDPHPEDRPFRISRCEDYFPENQGVKVTYDIAGSLHEHFHSRKPRCTCDEPPTVPTGE